jgi:Cytolethal distending toxin A/C domain
MTLVRHSLTSALLLALVATLALGFGATARAEAAPTQLTNAAQRQNAMEVLANGTVALRASKPASFRQKWEKEPFGTIGFRFRNLATNACLITPQTAINNETLRVGPCGGVGNRNLWRVHNPVKFNGAGQPVSVQTGQAPLPDSTGVLRLRPASFVASLGPIAEYFGM